MKLHRIDTVNLNSLYGEQVIDLEATLSAASLFLVHGPTGSGKSTLMDAVSLALFGVTPRLDAGHNDASRDPRAIMSRGTGECSAGIVFSKIEGGARHVYRARWTCWRARKKAHGAWQRPERSLEQRQDDGTWKLLVSSRRTKDYAPWFSKVLEGFGVRDFNRSMLLAQGQFDAFLGAPPDQRAEILERLTDTSVYQHIGERAARLHRRYAQQLTALRTLAAVGGGLDPDALTELQVRHQQNAALLEQRETEHQQAATHLRWFDRDIDLRRELTEAETWQATLTEEVRQAAPELDRLTEHERCDAARAFRLLDDHAEARGQLDRLRQQIQALEETLPSLRSLEAERQRATTAASARHRQAADQLEVLRPLTEDAIRTRATLTTAAGLAARTATELTQAGKAFEKGKKGVAAAKAAVTAAGTEHQAARTDLDAHASDGGLVERWPPLRSRLDGAVVTAQRLRADDEALDRRTAALDEERTRLTRERDAFEAARDSKLEAPRQALQQAEEALTDLQAGPDYDAAQRRTVDSVDAARARRDAVSAASPPLAAAGEAVSELSKLDARLEKLSAELETGRGELGRRTQAFEHHRELESQAAAGLDRTRRVAALVEHRVALEEGEACPLCGSEEHPWADDAERDVVDARLGQAVEEAERACDRAREARKQAAEALRESRDAVARLDAAAEVMSDQRTAAAARQVGLKCKATAALEAAGLPPDLAADGLEQAVQTATTQLAEAEERLTGLRKAHRAVERAERVLRKAIDAQKETEAGLRERDAALRERGERLTQDRSMKVEAQALLAVEQTECRALALQLGLDLQGDDPAAWRELGDARLREHQARVRAVSDLEARVRELEALWKGEEALLARSSGRRDELLDLLKEREADRLAQQKLAEAAGDALDEAWAATAASDRERPADTLPLAGATPDAVLAAQKTWTERARLAAEEADGEHRRALEASQTALTRQTTLEGQQEERSKRLEEADAELRAALAILALAGADALGERRLDDDQLTALRSRRKELEDRKVEVETRVRERRERAQAHGQERPETLAEHPERQTLAQAVAAAEESRDEAGAASRETGGQLRDHQRAVQEKEESRRRLLEAEEEARVWQTLHRCIGVNDGGRFKEFAQALNLGKLLDKANVHLARLSRRYRLVPRLDDGLPTLEFDLHDLWQAGERVAPRSLSGGERFLVSLSLALGLSDFRAVKMPIETLLLDEGFGTLDPDSLSVALGALGQLQADGRQVGIISHVVGLQERIEARIEIKPLGGGRSEVRTSDQR